MFSGGVETIGGGRYADGQWEVSTKGMARDAAVRMVSLHEIMHAQLNDSTAWGSLFHAYAALARHAPEPDTYRAVSLNVIEACRRTHEVFATYTGVFLADRATGRSLLAGRPGYLDHFDDACLLAAGLPEGSQVQWYAVISAIGACMQSQGLPEALAIGLERFVLADVRARDQPDRRLDMLIEEGAAVTADLVDEIEARLEPDDREAALRWLTGPPDGSADDVAEEIRDRAAVIAEQVCFARAAAALKGRGAPVLDYNGHQDYTEQTVSAVHALAPAARGTFWAAAADAAKPDTAIQDFVLERLRVRGEPLPARVLLLSDVPWRSRRKVLRMKAEFGGYAFMVARSAGTLRSQHAVYDTLRPLPVDDATPVVAVRTLSETAQATTIRLYQVRSPRQFRALHRQVGGLGILSSVSMSLLADPAWEDRWLVPLMRCGPVTILMDVDPFVHFRHWADLGLQVRYCFVEATAGGESRVGFTFLCRDPTGRSSLDDAVFVAVCSDLQADALSLVLRKQWPGMAQEDNTVATDRMPMLSVILSHLIAEETYFSFTGVVP